MDETTLNRFWSKVDIRSTDKCWNWKAGINSTGRGIFSYNGKSIHAHRMAWILTNGDIPKGSEILHKCDNGACVNPDHLFLGTQYDNMRDMINKGRKVIRHGADDPKSKLTPEDVREIRKLYKPRTVSQFALAKKYGVTRTCIQSILDGRIWKHI